MSNTTSSFLPYSDPQRSDTICSSRLRLLSLKPNTWDPISYTAKDLAAKLKFHLREFENLTPSQIHQDPQYKAFFDRFYNYELLNFHQDALDPNNPRFCVDFIRGLDELFFDGALMRHRTREQFNIQFAKHSSRRWRKEAERENGKGIVGLLEAGRWSGLVSMKGVTVFNNPHVLRFHDDSESVAAETFIYEMDLQDAFGYCSRDSRARFYLGTILKECLHALGGLYVCNCSACWDGCREIFTLSDSRHRFLEMALRLQKLANKVFGDIDLRLEESLAEELCLFEMATRDTIDELLDLHSHIFEGLELDKGKVKSALEKYFRRSSKRRSAVGEDFKENGYDSSESFDSVERCEDHEFYSDEDEWEGQVRNGFLLKYNCFYGDS